MRKSQVKLVAQAILGGCTTYIKSMIASLGRFQWESVLASNYGDRKYGKDNWKKIKWNQKARRIYAAATARHLIRATYPGRAAQDTGIDHMGHALSNLKIVLWMETHNTKSNSRNMKETKGKRDILSELGL